jgi:hypothetical protein
MTGACGWEPRRLCQEEHSQSKPAYARSFKKNSLHMLHLNRNLQEIKSLTNNLKESWECIGAGRVLLGGSVVAPSRAPALADKRHVYRIQRGKILNFLA